MINDEENYQVVQPGYYLIDMGFSGNAYGFNYSMMFNNILDKNYYQYADHFLRISSEQRKAERKVTNNRRSKLKFCN